MSQAILAETQGVRTPSGMREVTARYLQNWIDGVTQLDPDTLKAAVKEGGAEGGGEAAGLTTEPWLTGSPALLYGPSSHAEEPVTSIPPECIPLAEKALTRIRANSALVMASDVCFHKDGILHHHDLKGIHAYASSCVATARTYKLLELRPLVQPAVDISKATAFVLSSFKLQHRGSGSVSHGIQVDTVRFDVNLKITDAWVRRQLTIEERELMLQGGPASHPAAVFDETAIEAPVAEEGGERSPEAMAAAAAAAGDSGGAAGQSTEKAIEMMMQKALEVWCKVWQTAPSTAAAITCGGTEAQHPELDSILDEGFCVTDAVGVHALGHKAYQHMQGIAGMRSAINEMVAMNELSEWEYAHGVSPNSNIGFSMWQAQIKPRHRSSTLSGVGPVSGSQLSTDVKDIPPYQVQGVDLVVFNPHTGKLRAIYQLRSPTRREEREVLDPEGSKSAEAAY